MCWVTSNKKGKTSFCLEMTSFKKQKQIEISSKVCISVSECDSL